MFLIHRFLKPKTHRLLNVIADRRPARAWSMEMNGVNLPNVRAETAASIATLAPNNSFTQRSDSQTPVQHSTSMTDFFFLILISLFSFSRFTSQLNATTWGKPDTVQEARSVLLHMWKVSMFVMMIAMFWYTEPEAL